MGLKLLFFFGSQVSMWLGPPSSQKRITALALPSLFVDVDDAAAERYSLSVRPRKPSDPTFRKSLREGVWRIIDSSLMILRKFARADQGPHEFTQSGFAVAALRQNRFQFL